ncbi:hypothetical protein OAU55_00095 [Candidatus Pelagibacter sp.]|nr:hypothetical protein [Candidatus Pelagibacter sp.]
MTREEKIRAAKIRQAKARQALIGQTLKVDPMVPRADPVGYVAPETEKRPTDFRTEFSQPGIDLMSQASYQGGGVVDVPDEMPLYSADGIKIKFPKLFQEVVEFAGDLGAFSGGAVVGGMGYVVGGMADLMVKAGFDEGNAKRLARDIMAMPDAFAGSLGTLAKPRGSRGSINKTVASFTDAEQDAMKTAFNANDGLPDNLLPVDTVQLSPAELGTLLQQASKGGRASQAATEKLAMEAKTNPEAAAAAARLGIDLPPDVLSDNPLLKNAAAMTRDLKASEAAGQFETIVINASNAADEAMATINASPDLSTISERVLSNLTATQAALKKGASDLYKLVDDQVPKSSLARPNNTVRLLNNLSEELGGIDNLSSNEKLLFDKLTNPDTPLTYAALVRLKQDIGRGLERGQGPYGDVNQGALKRIYGALSEDQLLTVEQIGGPELRSQLRLANQTTAKQKAFEKRIVNAFGKDLEGSIASKLRQAITAGTKGDIAGLNRILKTIPKELQREAIATAINSLSLPGGATDLPFGFAQYAKTIKGLKKEKAIYNKIISVLGPESDQFLTDLLNVSQRITEARGRVSQTGKANQAMILEGLTAENIAMRLWNSSIGRRVVRGAAAGSGVVSGGPAGGAAADLITDVLLSSGKTDRVAAAGNLLNSAAFKSLVDADFAANQVALQTALDKLEKSPAFKRWLKSVEMTPSAGRNLLQISIVAGADEGEVAPVAEEPVAEVDISQSPALQSLIQTTNPSVLNATP